MTEELAFRVMKNFNILEKFIVTSGRFKPSDVIVVGSPSELLEVKQQKETANVNGNGIRSVRPTSSVIVDQFWPVLRFLRFCGNLPIDEVENDEGRPHPRQFVAKLQSKATAYAAVVGGSYLLAWIFFLVNFLLEQPWVENIFKSIKEDKPLWSNLVRTIVKAMVTLHPITMILEIPAVWFGSRHLVSYLNNWHKIEHELSQTFPTAEFKFDLRPYRNLMALGYVLIPFTVFVILHAGDQFIPGSYVVLNFAILLFYSFSLMGVSLVEDTKVILMYRIQQQVFRWMRLGMADQYEACNRSKTTLQPATIKDWLRILNLIREQHHLMCECQLYHQIFNMACSLFLYTSHLFVLFGSLQSGAGYQMTLPCLMLCTIMFGRLLFKATMAQTVTNEEQEIGTLLAQMECVDSDTRMETKFIFDLIAVCPSHVNFGNFFTYNRRFMMGVVGQSVTYLIVLMQFSATIQYG